MTLEKFILSVDKTANHTDKIKAEKFPNNELEIYAYYDDSNCLHFLIDTELNIIENRKGLKIKNEFIEVINKGKTHFLNFYCSAPDFEPNFIKIFEEILSDYKARKDLEKSIKIIINKWYFFFEKEKQVQLNDQEVIGAIGELYFINEYITKTNDIEILKYWKGPEKYPNDFSFPNYDIEIKTSTKEIGHVHTINGQTQITLVDDMPLFLYSLSLKRTASESSITLEKIVNALIEAFSIDAYTLNSFFEKLELLSVNPYECETYNNIKVELKDVLTIKIEKSNINSFTISSSNTRISNVKYDLDLNGLENVTYEIL